MLVAHAARDLLGPDAATEAAKAWAVNQVGMKDHPSAPDEHPDNRKLLAAVWGLVGDGLVFPRLKAHTPDGHPHPIDRVVLTERGVRVVTGTVDHPLRPGFLDRFRKRAPGMNDEVVARIEDAVTCLEKGVPRAAVVMVGLAVEESIRIAHDALCHLKLIPKAAKPLSKARDLLAEVRKADEIWQNTDERHRFVMALVAFESIRVERNKASHPGANVNDEAAVEELLILAARQVPVIWEIAIMAATGQGYVVT